MTQRTPPGAQLPLDPPPREDPQEEAAAATRALADAEAESARLTLAKAEVERLKRRKAREQARARQEAEQAEIAAAVERSEAEEEERTEAARTDRRVATSSVPKAKKSLATRKTLAVKTRGTGRGKLGRPLSGQGASSSGMSSNPPTRPGSAGLPSRPTSADQAAAGRQERPGPSGFAGLPPPGPPLYTEEGQGGEDPLQQGGSARGGSTTISAPPSAGGRDQAPPRYASSGEQQLTTADPRQLPRRQQAQVDVHQPPEESADDDEGAADDSGREWDSEGLNVYTDDQEDPQTVRDFLYSPVQQPGRATAGGHRPHVAAAADGRQQPRQGQEEPPRQDLRPQGPPDRVIDNPHGGAGVPSEAYVVAKTRRSQVAAWLTRYMTMLDGALQEEQPDPFFLIQARDQVASETEKYKEAHRRLVATGITGHDPREGGGQGHESLDQHHDYPSQVQPCLGRDARSRCPPGPPPAAPCPTKARRRGRRA